MAVALTPTAHLHVAGFGDDAPWTWCGWRRIGALAPVPEGTRALFHAGVGAANGRMLLDVDSTGRVGLWRIDGSSGGGTFSDELIGATRPTVAVGEWWWFAIVRINGNVAVLWAREDHGSITGAVAAFRSGVSPSPPPDTANSSDEIYLGRLRYPDFGEYLDGALAHDRMWHRALSSAELEAERSSRTAELSTDLWADWPGTTTGTDASGHGRHLTAEPGTGGLTADVSPLSDATALVHLAGGGALRAEGVPGTSALLAGGGVLAVSGEFVPPPEIVAADWAVFAVALKHRKKRVRN